MAKLPTVSPANTLTRAPQTTISPGEVANPFHEMAQHLDRMGSTFLAARHEKAAQEGAASVYRDDDGDLKVDFRSNLSGTGQAYNRAARQAYVTRLSADVRRDGQRIMQEAGNDATAFSKLWKSHIGGVLKSAPKEIRGSVTALLETEGERFFNGILQKKHATDIATFEADMKAEISAIDDEMAALARGGGVGTPEYAEKQSQLASLYNELVQNPEFSMSQKQAEISLRRMQSRHAGEGIVGSIETTLKRDGAEAAIRLAKSIETDESLLLTPAERRQYSNLADQAIREYQSGRSAELKPLQELSKGYSERLKQGLDLDNPEVDQIAEKLAMGGDPAGAMKLLRERATARFMDTFQRSGDADQVSSMERFVSGGEADAAEIIRGFEGFRDTPYWDVNALRAGYGSDTITLADGTVRRVKDGDRVSRADAERDLERRVAEFEGIARSKVGERWDALPGNVRAALTSITYNYGEIPDRLMDAIENGDSRDIAFAVERLAGDNDGINAKRRKREAAIIRGEGNYSVDPDVVGKMRTEITADAKDLWGGIKSGIEDGFDPSPDEVDLLARQLILINDEDFRAEVSSFFASHAAGRDIAMMPPDRAQEIVDALKREASDGSPVVQQEIVSTLQKSVDATRKAIDTDILGFGLSRKMIADLPSVLPGKGVDLVASMQSREKSALKMGAMYGRGDVSIFRANEISAVKQFLSDAPVSQQAAYLGAMAESLSPDMLRASLSDLAEKGGMGELASAGMLAKVNPEASQSILRGKSLLKENPAFAPKKDEQLTISRAELLPATLFPNGMEGARQGILDAAMARYADLSSQAGDESRELNYDRLRQSIDDVTGGLVDFNGSAVIAPEYGMSQDQFDRALQSLPSSALEGAVDASGYPVSKIDILSQARLKAIGPGEYLIEFGGDGYGQYVMRAPSGPGRNYGGGPFILRIGGDGVSS